MNTHEWSDMNYCTRVNIWEQISETMNAWIDRLDWGQWKENVGGGVKEEKEQVLAAMCEAGISEF